MGEPWESPTGGPISNAQFDSPYVKCVKERMVELVESEIDLGEERERARWVGSLCGHRQLAAALGPPVTASGHELCQMIDGTFTNILDSPQISRFWRTWKGGSSQFKLLLRGASKSPQNKTLQSNHGWSWTHYKRSLRLSQ